MWEHEKTLEPKVRNHFTEAYFNSPLPALKTSRPCLSMWSSTIGFHCVSALVLK